MLLKQTVEVLDLLDSSTANGEEIKELLLSRGLKNVKTKTVEGKTGSTDFIKAVIPGTNGKLSGGKAPTLGIVGRLGGLGARPTQIGFVSDGDGAAAVLAAALKFGDMLTRGDVLEGDTIIATHICPNAPINYPMMGSPVDMTVMNETEIDPQMDAILSVDTTKGNRIYNHRGFTITPTIKEGWILRPSDDLIDIMYRVTGEIGSIFAVTTQDITPYGNGVSHINSILQPSCVTNVPLVGVPIVAHSIPIGCSTGSSHEIDIALTATFCIEVAKDYGRGKCSFYKEDEWDILMKKYGPLHHLQTQGK
ncbi:MAG: DUF1177 domain-containing protein [Peptococcaceae bacterium]